MMDFVIKKKRKKHSTTKKLTTNAEFIKMLRVSRSTGFAEQVATKTQRQRIQHVTSTVDTNMLNYFNQQQVAKLNKEGGILYLFLGEQAPLHESELYTRLSCFVWSFSLCESVSFCLYRFCVVVSVSVFVSACVPLLQVNSL